MSNAVFSVVVFVVVVATGSVIPRPCSQQERRGKKRLTFRFVSFVRAVQHNPRSFFEGAPE